MDIAELGLAIRSDGVVVATDRLEKFDYQAGRTSKTVDLLLKAFGALAAAFGISKLIEYTNTWTDLNSRVEIATGSIGKGAATMERLAEMARRTYSSLELTAESFLRNSTAMRDLGYNTGETLDFVEAINNALVVSGAKGERAESVMNALGKAMALGKLSGDQLETVLASGGRITEALAASLGVTTLELRKLGTEGKLTGDVIYEALTGQLQLLRDEADSMAYTIGDAAVLLNNSMLTMIGTFDETSAISYVVATAIIAVADAMDNGTISIERILAIAIAMGAFMAGSWVVSFIAANGAVAALTAGLTLLRGALIRTGIGALVVLAGELLYQLYEVVKGARSIEDAFARLKRSGLETWERITDGGSAMYHSMEYWALEIASMYLMTWTKIQNGFFDMLRQLGAATGIAIPGMEAWENSIINSFDQATKLHTAALAAQTAARDAFAAMSGDKSTMSDTGTMPGFGDLAGLGGEAGGGGGGGAGGATGATDAYTKLTNSIMENIDALTLEAETMGMSEFQASKLATAQDLLRAAAEAKIPITTALVEQINALSLSYAEAEMAVAAAEMRMANREPWEIMASEIQRLDEMVKAGAISWQEYHAAAAQSMAGAANATLGSLGQITGALASAFEGNKAFAVANAVINTAEGVTKALAQGGMFAFPIAAAIAAAGAAQIGAIMSASPGGGSAAAVRAPSAPSVQNDPQRQQAERTPDRMDITLHGLDRNAMYSGDNIERLIGLIEERSGDGRILNIKVA